jgi:hypothetical protein
MPPRDAVDRLTRRGMVAWRVDGVLARLTQRQSSGTDLAKAVAREVVEAGAQAAVALRKRVTDNGDLAGQRFPGYSTRLTSRGMSDDYMRAAGAPVPHPETYKPRGETKTYTYMRYSYLRSSDFHRAADVKDGSYNVTGGMWAGLQARGTGKAGVIIDFAGSSLGSGGEREVKVKGRTRYTYTSARVRNSWKARGIFDNHKVHVLKLSRGELDGMGLRITRQFNKWLAIRLGGENV